MEKEGEIVWSRAEREAKSLSKISRVRFVGGWRDGCCGREAAVSMLVREDGKWGMAVDE